MSRNSRGGPIQAIMASSSSSSTSSSSSRHRWLFFWRHDAVLLLLLLLLSLTTKTLVSAEKRSFEILLEPSEQFIHYTDGLIRGPGVIDLRGLGFTAVSEPLSTPPSDDLYKSVAAEEEENDEGDENKDWDDVKEENLVPVHDDDDNGKDDDDDTADDNTRGRNKKWRRRWNKNRRQLQNDGDTGGNGVGSTIDIAAFHLPHKCSKSRKGCDWASIGVGGRLPQDKADTSRATLRWCCNDEAIAGKLCSAEKRGRLLVNRTVYKGETRFVDVPATGPMQNAAIHYGELEAHETGQYVVLFANCNTDKGRDVLVVGESVWKSVHGYLPGELYGFMFFYATVLAVYLVLFIWYLVGMHVYQDARIPIEKWILMTIILGTLEMFCRTADDAVWNFDGWRVNLLAYISIIAGVIKKGISRCLIVMVSLGWGVVRDTLGSTIRTIVVLGAAYVGVAAAVELMIVFAVQDMQVLSYDEEVKIFDIVTILSIVVVIIDVIFVLWILDALNGTMEYLEQQGQMRKLARYLSLRCIFLFAILFAAVRLVFMAVDTYDEEGIVREEHEWVIDAAEEFNYLFILIGVAWLWRPNPNAKEYAYVMEVPLNATDDENGGTELELTGVVPSAMDDDDEDDDGGGGYRNNNGYHDDKDNGDNEEDGGRDDRFQIDDAEAT